MDTAMRDMERLEEQHDDAATRKLGTILMASVATVALVLSMGVLLGRSDVEATPAEDPLATLERAAGLAALEASELEEEAVPEAAPMEVPEVRRETLSFPNALEQYDPRPEVEAAIAAAAAELEHPEPLIPAGDLAAPPSPSPAELGFGGEVPEALEPSLPPSLPAAVAAGTSGETLTRTAPHDPLVRAALPREPSTERAPVGREGRYTLQVISYQDSQDARIFADGLRNRGHQAFVVRADVPNRGTHYRVRIGPFETMREAQEYRERFEMEERMNTFVVRRRDQDE